MTRPERAGQERRCGLTFAPGLEVRYGCTAGRFRSTLRPTRGAEQNTEGGRETCSEQTVVLAWVQFSPMRLGAALSLFLLPCLHAEPCAPNLLAHPDRESTLPYTRQPNGRCEGVYARDVAGTGEMLIAALGVQPLSFDPHGPPSLSVKWNSPTGGVVHITAHSLKPGVFYQMDAEAPGDSREYQWPLDYLKKSSLGAGEVGLVAWTQMPVGNTPQVVFLPVNVSSASAPGISAPFKLMVTPPVELSLVTKTVREVAASGARQSDRDGRPRRHRLLSLGTIL